MNHWLNMLGSTVAVKGARPVSLERKARNEYEQAKHRTRVRQAQVKRMMEKKGVLIGRSD